MENLIQLMNLLIMLVTFLILILGLVVLSRKFGLSLFKSKKVTGSSFDLIMKEEDLSSEKYMDLDMKSFDDIVGLTELKDELKQFLAVFNDKEKFSKNGVEIPRGILLWGPPGCGKTSLAKAIAKEAGVNFLCRNAADIVSNIGSGIDDLFRRARTCAPCIIFIDELDIIGSRSFGGMAGAHQVEVTKLLAEMDGFQLNTDILVIGATNDKSTLDPALLRSGRFSKHFYVGSPKSFEDVIDVYKMYVGKKPVDQNLSYKELYHILNGLSPADIKDVLNEAGTYAVLSNSEITLDILTRVVIEKKLNDSIGLGALGSDELKHTIAVHEAGHAVVSMAYGRVPASIMVSSNTILDNDTRFNRAYGNESEQYKFNDYIRKDTLKDYLESIVITYGGICAERQNFNSVLNVTLGCGSDMKMASKLLYSLLSQYTYNFDNFACSQVKRGENYVDLIEDWNKYASEYLSYFESLAKDIISRNKRLFDRLVDLLMENSYVEHSELIKFEYLVVKAKEMDIKILQKED